MAPTTRSVCWGDADGSTRLTTPIARIVRPGAIPRARWATLGNHPSNTIGRPASTPSTIKRAARSAFMDSTGRDADGANHAYSFCDSPVK